MSGTAESRNASRIFKRALSAGISALFFVAFLSWLPGRHDWFQGWLFVGVLVVGHTTSAIYMWRRDPEVLRRRSTVGAGTKSWDKWLWMPVTTLLYLTSLTIGALDTGRHGWSAMPIPWSVAGAVAYLTSIWMLTWCMAVNTHFETTVRIQTDRDHRVIDSGPYRFIRHPGYAAILCGFNPGIALMLGSWWACIPVGLASAWLVVRTALEDRVLHRELTGYADYATRVRWRLLPGVW